jgi:hypothetical protein
MRAEVAAAHLESMQSANPTGYRIRRGTAG